MGRPAARARRVARARRSAGVRRMALLCAASRGHGDGQQRRDFVPQVRVATVRPSDSTDGRQPCLPPPRHSQAANIFARASGYIDKRDVDIGDHVKEGQLLAEIVAPELDHQIAQAEATLAQLKATLQQAQANMRARTGNLGSRQPAGRARLGDPAAGHTDRLTLKAQEAAVAVAQANVDVAARRSSRCCSQQKVYQRVVAPFDGVITQRNIDVGSLVQADATSGTFMFTIMQSNVIRTQVYVPQDQAFGVRRESMRSCTCRKSRIAAFPAQSRGSPTPCIRARGHC